MALSQEIEDILNQGYRYALSLTYHEDDAYDLVQNAYLKIIEKKKPLVISYLIRTIRNGFIDSKRKEKFKLKWFDRRRVETHVEPNFGVEPYLEKIINALPETNREIIFLSVVQEYTAQEISDLTGKPRGTILSILHRTKKKLREQLEEKQRYYG